MADAIGNVLGAVVVVIGGAALMLCLALGAVAVSLGTESPNQCQWPGCGLVVPEPAEARLHWAEHERQAEAATWHTAEGPAFTHSENFAVCVSGLGRPAALAILKAAEGYRRQIAVDWFGAPLPAGARHATIHAKASATEDSGATVPPIGFSERSSAMVFLRGRP